MNAIALTAAPGRPAGSSALALAGLLVGAAGEGACFAITTRRFRGDGGHFLLSALDA